MAMVDTSVMLRVKAKEVLMAVTVFRDCTSQLSSIYNANIRHTHRYFYFSALQACQTHVQPSIRFLMEAVNKPA